MAMTRGTVTVADDESRSGSGYALDLYDEIKSVEEAYRPLPSLTPPPSWEGTLAGWLAEIKPVRLRILRAWAREATRASLVVTYLLNNAELQVGTGDSALQQTPNPNNADTDTQAPTATRTFGNLL